MLYESVDEELSKLPISMVPKTFTFDEKLMAFDATSFYACAMYDGDSVFPKIEGGH